MNFNDEWKKPSNAVAYAIGAINMALSLVIIATGIDLYRSVEQLNAFRAKAMVRAKAQADMHNNRLKAQVWTYDQVCVIMKQKGSECLASPVWWADPDKYPELANDELGTGVFPK